MKYPKISFVTPMKEQDFRVIGMLRSIRKQNYPQNKIEIIITDGGSNPKVLEKCREYNVKIFNNKKGFAEGAGMGKDQGIWRSTGEYIVISESDLEYIGNNWIVNMIKPFIENNILGAVPKLFVNQRDNLTNRYLSYLGVDPFAAYRSIEGQIALNENLKKKLNENYTILDMDPKNPFCMGSNGFMFKKSLVREIGDYAQDVEFIARLVKNGYTRFAYVKDAPVWHKNIESLNEFIKKRIKWTRNYSGVYIKEKKDFNWITNKMEFFSYVLKNLLLFPNIPISIKRAFQYRDTAWLLHSPLLFFSTMLNILYSLTSRKMLEQIFN